MLCGESTYTAQSHVISIDCPSTAQHEMRPSLGRAANLFARADRQRQTQMGQPDRSSEIKTGRWIYWTSPSSALSHLQALSNGHRAVWAVVMSFVCIDYSNNAIVRTATLCCTSF